MVVQHNLSAMNANRMLGITQGTLSSSTEKLSSGYKVNRAADDAAGLSISEKMRKQIRGLDQASANAEDGISAVQTAEGALTEVHDMLQRMNELAVKAANGTNSEDDRQTIQDEISQLTTEIDRVAETTKFNETYLLKGNGSTVTKQVNAHDAGLSGKLVDNGDGTATFTADKLSAGDTVTIGGTEYNIVESQRPDQYMSIKDDALGATNADASGSYGTITQDGVTYTLTSQTSAGTTNLNNLKDSEGNAASITLREGAVYTTTLGVSYTLVGNSTATLKQTTATATPTWAKGDTIVSSDGTEYTYVEDGGYLNNIKYDDGGGFYKTTGNSAGDTAYTAKAGDTYTIKSTGESNVIANKGIDSVSHIQDAIKALEEGDEVTIYKSGLDSSGSTFQVGVSTKEDGTAYTADDIAKLVEAGNIVMVDTAYYYAVPDVSDESTDITAKEAYALMADELQQASSIGADSDSQAKVVVGGATGQENVFTITKGTTEVSDTLSFALHVGADADMTNKIIVGIDSMSAAGLGIKDIDVTDDTGMSATYAIDAIEDAIKTVSKQRSALGAVQNRLDHTINNLDNVVENTTSAESAIRDTDMAEEMVTYSNANILAQAGQSMLAQANQSNQGVLSLLG